MTTFTIDSENNITAHVSAAAAQSIPDVERFTSLKELTKLAGKWSGSRLVEIWNSLPGQKPVTKFASRDKAAARIWAAIQTLAPDTAAQAAPEATKNGRTGRRATPAKPARTAREGSKKAIVLNLLKQNGGATLRDLMSATGWLAHSVRGFISGTLGKKMHLTVTSAKAENGERTYSIKD
jgi:hypothetical protein